MSKPRNERSNAGRPDRGGDRRDDGGGRRGGGGGGDGRGRGGDRRGGGGRGPQGAGGRQGQGRGPQAGGGGGGGGGGGRHQKPAVEVVVADEGASVAADVYRTDVPPEWREIPPIVFFKSGVFVRAQGAVKQVSRDLAIDRAVVYAAWEDPTATYMFEGREVRPGLTASLLIPSNDPDGPPWVPIQAVVGSGQFEIESGILSPWLDQVACARFRPQFTVAKKRLNVSTDTSVPVEPDRKALGDTLRWLVKHPGEDNALARLARVMLVDDGHGLQRYGVSLMHAEDSEKLAAIDEVLVPLAPEVGALLRALWLTWESPRALRETAGLPDALADLCAAIEKGLSEDSVLQLPSSLALIVAWTAGLFGIRAERSGRQPARTLFAAARAIRRSGRQLKALSHPDSPLPRFPLDRAENSELLRDMSRLPRNETNFERLVRALAIAESAWQFSRPRRDHLRPFRIVFPMVRGYPNAARSFMGRFDYVFTGWSFRGAELRDDGLPDGALAGVFITQSASVTSTRAFARVVATPSKAGASVAAGLRSLPDTPTLSQVGAFREMPDADVTASYAEAAGHDRMTWLRLQQAVSSAEYLIAKSEVGEAVDEFTLRTPAFPGEPDGGVRAHFMYWRMFCRSIAWKLPDVYGDFIASAGPRLAELPPKLQTELFALAKRWALHSDENRAAAASWAPWLQEAAAGFFDVADRTWLDGEWIEALVGVLAIADREATVQLLERLAGDPGLRIGSVDRLLDGVRSAGWSRDLVELPVFRAFHARLAATSTVHGIRARVEWTRAVVDRARHSEGVRWLLDDRAYPRVLGSSDFAEWFSTRGEAAIRAPDDAIVELLEIALRHIAPTHLDIALRHLDTHTLWPAEQHIEAIRAAGRPDGVVTRLRMAATGTPEAHAEAVAALFDGTSGRAVRDAGVALAHFVATRGESETASILRDGLAGSVERYRPFRFALDGFLDALHGWKVAGLGLRAPAATLAETAARWHRETGAEPLAQFVGWLADTSARDALAAPLREALTGDDDALRAALAAVALPVELLPAYRTTTGRGRRSGGAVRAALTGAGVGPVLDAAVAAAVRDALGAVEPDALGARLATLAGVVSALDLSAGSAPEADEEDASVLGGASGEGDAPSDEQQVDARDQDAGDTTPGAEGGDDAPDAEDTSSATTPAFDAKRRAAIQHALGGALRRWSALVPRLGTIGESTRTLLDRAAQHAPAPHALRAELFAGLGGLRDDLRAIGDPRRLLTTDFTDGLTLDVDPADFVLIVDALRRVAMEHGGTPKATVDSRWVGVALPKVVAGDSEGQGEDAEAPPDTEHSGADADDDGPGEVAAAGDEQSDTSSAVDSDAPSDKASTAPTLAEIMKAGYAADADEAARVLAFGEPGVPLLLRHLAKRNGLSISVGNVRKRPALVVKWNEGRR